MRQVFPETFREDKAHGDWSDQERKNRGKIGMKTFAMSMISMLTFIGAMGPINLSELPACRRRAR